MKKWITIAGMLILTLPVMAQATDYPSTNVTITLSAGYTPVSYAYESTNNTIAELFAELSNGSIVHVWNSASQSWTSYNRGLTSWGAAGTNRLTRGVGALVQITGQKVIHFSGALPLDETTAVYKTNGAVFIAYPYPVDVAFTNTEIAKTAVNGDEIQVLTATGWVTNRYNDGWDSGARNLILTNCNSAFKYVSTNANSVVYEIRPYPPCLPSIGWMDQYGLTNYLEDAAADSDGDGLAVWQEYIAGTDPTNPASGFCVTEDPQNVLGWSAVSGRVYSVYWTTNLMNDFQCLESNIPWTQVSFTNSTDAPCGYYKIGVQLEN